MIKRISLLILFVFAPIVLAQESPSEQIKQLYENFEYDKVIQKSESFLSDPQIGDSTKIDIYLMRAGSFYFYKNTDQVKNSFEKILLIRKDYSPNNAQFLNSTLINIFNVVKTEYLKRLKEIETKKDSTNHIYKIIYDKQISYGGAFLKNMALPGWGQLSLGKDRGFFFSLAYVANVSALIYYMFDTSEKQGAYQREIDTQRFDQLYSDYNKSYKIRNSLFITWAVILVYSQIDLLLFHDKDQLEIEPNRISIQSSSPSLGTYGFSLRIPL
jgi:hypothetical protein